MSKKLFDLIHSLNKNEKGYFLKNSIKSKKTKNYLIVYKAYRDAKTYNEAIIQKQIKNINLLKQLPVVKNYIYNAILNSLSIYYSKKNPEFQIFDLIKHFKILMLKGLDKEAIKHLDKAKKISTDLGYPKLALYIFKLRTQLNFRTDKGQTLKYRMKSDQDYANQIDSIYKINKYRILYREVYASHRKILIKREGEEFEKMNTLIKSQLLSISDSKLSLIEKYWKYNILSIYYKSLGNLNKSLYYRKMQVNIFSILPEKIRKKNIYYYNSLFDLINRLVELEMPKELEKNLSLIKQISAHFPFQSKATTLQLINIELMYRIKTFNKEKCEKIISLLEQTDKKNFGDYRYFTILLIYSNSAYYFFTTNNYPRALNFINKILNYKEPDLYFDIYLYIQILQILIYFDLLQYLFVESLTKSLITKLHLKKLTKRYSFEYCIIHFFLVATKEKFITTRAHKNILKGLEVEIKNYLTTNNPPQLLNFVDVKLWIKSKLENKTMEEELKNQ